MTDWDFKSQKGLHGIPIWAFLLSSKRCVIHQKFMHATLHGHLDSRNSRIQIEPLEGVLFFFFLSAYTLLFSWCRLDPLQYYLHFLLYLKVNTVSMLLHDLDLGEVIIFEILTLKRGTFFSLTSIKNRTIMSCKEFFLF